MSASEWRTDIREGYRTKEMKIGNVIATVHRPILSAEERKRIEDQVRISMLGMIEEKQNAQEQTA